MEGAVLKTAPIMYMIDYVLKYLAYRFNKKLRRTTGFPGGSIDKSKNRIAGADQLLFCIPDFIIYIQFNYRQVYSDRI